MPTLEISPIKHPRPSHATPARGFTLIELLVAVAIAATLSGVALLSINFGGADTQLRDEARRLFQLARIASDEAIFQTTEYGVRFTQSDYAFYTLISVESDTSQSSFNSSDSSKKTKRELRWQASTDSPHLRAREWPEDVEIEVYVEGLPIVLDEKRDEKAEQKDEKLRPHLMFLSNGEVLPDVEVQLRSTESEKAWRIGIGEDGVLALGLIEE
ncbi:MAG: prepilin-type N-terminal cleavage/methylation domain-containing protein [Pseudomonadota bacterium]